MSKKETPEEPKVYKAKLSDFRTDPRNLNQHTQRGRSMVEASMRARGYARPAFAAKDGTLLGGNLSTGEVAADIDLGAGEVLVVESDGKIPIIHKRKDIDPGSNEAILLSAEDNRSSEIGINWDAELLAEDIAQGVDFSGLWYEDEMDYLLADIQTPDFEPVGAETQPRLDQKSPITCPHCGEEFVPE